jgi:hypothetical protein
MNSYDYTPEEPEATENEKSIMAYQAMCQKRNELWSKRYAHLMKTNPNELIPPQAMLDDIAKYLSIIPTQAEISAKLSGVDALLTAFETAAEIKCDSVTAVLLDECRNQWRFAVRSFDPMMQQTSNEVWVIVADITSKLTRRAFGANPYCQKWKSVVFDGGMGEL